jgi:hypothetical protein
MDEPWTWTGDACDNCVLKPNVDQADADRDGKGDVRVLNKNSQRLKRRGFESFRGSLRVTRFFFAPRLNGSHRTCVCVRAYCVQLCDAASCNAVCLVGCAVDGGGATTCTDDGDSTARCALHWAASAGPEGCICTCH